MIGKGRENHCVQLPREEVHPRAMTVENTISVGKSPCLRWKFSPLARVACGPKDTRGHFFYQKRADLALSRWAQLGAFSAVALRLNTSEKTEISYIRRFCFAFWDFASCTHHYSFRLDMNFGFDFGFDVYALWEKKRDQSPPFLYFLYFLYIYIF